MRRASVYPQQGFGTEGLRRLPRIRSGFQILINFSERGGAAAVVAEAAGWLAGWLGVAVWLVGGRRQWLGGLQMISTDYRSL